MEVVGIFAVFVVVMVSYKLGYYNGRDAKMDQQFRDWATRQRPNEEDDADWWKRT